MADNKLTIKDITEVSEGKKICFKESSMELASRFLAMRDKLRECAECIRDVGAGKDGWAWEEVADGCTEFLD